MQFCWPHLDLCWMVYNVFTARKLGTHKNRGMQYTLSWAKFVYPECIPQVHAAMNYRTPYSWMDLFKSCGDEVITKLLNSCRIAACFTLNMKYFCLDNHERYLKGNKRKYVRFCWYFHFPEKFGGDCSFLWRRSEIYGMIVYCSSYVRQL